MAACYKLTAKITLLAVAGPLEVLVQVDALVVRERDAAAEVWQLELGEPAVGEVLVRSLATGVCHSDLHCKHGCDHSGVALTDAGARTTS